MLGNMNEERISLRDSVEETAMSSVEIEHAQKRLARRKFLRGVTAGAAGGLVLGVGSAALLIRQAKQKWDKEADVVIVGGGASGCAAAVSAAEAGAEVVLTETNPVLGGAGSVCVGSITAPLSSLQKKAGVTDSAESYMEDILKLSGLKASRMDKTLLRLLAENAGATIDWLLSLGVDIQGPFEYPGHRAKRLHVLYPKSAEWPKVIKPVLEQKKVEMLLGTKGTNLYRDENADNRVLGVKAVDQNTMTSIAIKARKAVILTAGSLEGSPALRARATIPQIADIPAAVATNDGSGLTMAAAVGANMTFLEGFGVPAVRGMPPGPCVEIAKQAWMPYGVVDAGAILVNNEGKRFVDETLNSADLCLALITQPNKTCHMVFDQRVASIFNKWPMVFSSMPGIADVSKIGGFGLVEDFVARGAIKRAESISGLAVAVGVDPAGLEAEIGKWNRYCRDRKDLQFDRPTFGVKDANTVGIGINVPPFYCHTPLRALVVLADTTLLINRSFQVLDVFGNVIPSLYAAGNIGHGNLVLFGPGHGMHISWAFTSGRLSAKVAAAEKAWA
jgi:FAD binding domain